MQLLKNNFIVRVVAFIVSFQIINTSIDTPAAQIESDNNSKDDFNYIDTYVEYFAEVVFKYENAIPESGNRQQKELQQHKHQIITQATALLFSHPLFAHDVEIFSCRRENNYFSTFIKEINPPPEVI